MTCCLTRQGGLLLSTEFFSALSCAWPRLLSACLMELELVDLSGAVIGNLASELQLRLAIHRSYRLFLSSVGCVEQSDSGTNLNPFRSNSCARCGCCSDLNPCNTCSDLNNHVFAITAAIAVLSVPGVHCASNL